MIFASPFFKAIRASADSELGTVLALDPLMDNRRMPIGAEAQSSGGVHFRVWAPDCRKLSLVFVSKHGGERVFDLEEQERGYFSRFVDEAHVGSRYYYRRSDMDLKLPDPASRYQPEGPHGPSEVIDPKAFLWNDHDWKGLSPYGQVLYQMHVGTFTRSGTWQSARQELPRLKELGVTCIKMMPIGEFAGSFGWGYDGVDFFAPYHFYGRPDDLRSFIDHAHENGIGVLLDVVYNHLGPAGNYLGYFAQNYFSDQYKNDWGRPLNFDGPQSRPVREFVLSNARYWIQEFHFDGFRVDATQCIFDVSEHHILEDFVQVARTSAPHRRVLIIGENEPQDVRYLKKIEDGGFGFDALWSDDFHHAWRVALTGRREGYYQDYRGTAVELSSVAQSGILYQGQYNLRQGKRRGTSSAGFSQEHFVVYLQNHDQTANAAASPRVNTLCAPASYRAAVAAQLLSPETPMLFQGQEWGTSSPFHYFADHDGELAELVEKGRRSFLTQFPSLGKSDSRILIPPPHERSAFEACVLDFQESFRENGLYRLHCDLLRLRQEDSVLRQIEGRSLRSGVIAEAAWVLRYTLADGEERLVVVNLGSDLSPTDLQSIPLLAPLKSPWNLILSTEDEAYGGSGVAPPNKFDEWSFAGRSTTFLSGAASS